MRLVPHLLGEGDVAVDVGANGANWTLPLARRVGAAGRVFAFEADPYYARVTERTLALLGAPNVEFFSFGLSDRNETAPLVVFGADRSRLSGHGHIARADAASAQGTEDASAEPDEDAVLVELRRLDDLVAEHPRLAEVRLFKCDVEGFEWMVFRGARSLLERARPVVVAEMGGAALHGHSDADLFDFFDGLGYASYAVGAAPEELIPTRSVGATRHGRRPNRVFLPRERALPAPLRIVGDP